MKGQGKEIEEHNNAKQQFVNKFNKPLHRYVQFKPTMFSPQTQIFANPIIFAT